MNPFNFHGPEFLLFYILFSAVVLAALVLLRRSAESGPLPKLDLSDPYLIAYLRGGANEAARVGVVSLIDRGLLAVDGTTVQAGKKSNVATARRPIEQAILNLFRSPVEAKTIFGDAAIKAACQPYENTLMQVGALPTPAVKSARGGRLAIALVLLLTTAILKIVIALARGRTNIGFLIILTGVVVVVASVLSFPRLTYLGARLIDDVQSLYGGLRGRAARMGPGGGTMEAAMLAACFGISALDGASYGYVRSLFPKAATSSSGCGSACGSSCGSSCGGGGCGGGCGGCGS